MPTNPANVLRHTASLGCTFWVLLLGIGSASAQQLRLPSDLQTKQVVLDVKKQSLADIVAYLSTKLGVNILIDGEPLLTQADIDFKGTAKDALDKVADLFDYTWMVSKRGVILMNKRFKNPKEYPQLSLPELRQTARDMVTILSSLPYDPVSAHHSNLVQQLFQSLTPQQVQALQVGKTLRANDLAPEQQNLLQQSIWNGALAGTRTFWTTLLTRLGSQFDDMTNGNFQLKQAMNYRTLDYVYPDEKGQQQHKPLLILPGEQKPAEQKRE